MLRNLYPVYLTKILMEGSADITTNTTFKVLCSHLPLDCVTCADKIIIKYTIRFKFYSVWNILMNINSFL